MKIATVQGSLDSFKGDYEKNKKTNPYQCYNINGLNKRVLKYVLEYLLVSNRYNASLRVTTGGWPFSGIKLSPQIKNIDALLINIQETEEKLFQLKKQIKKGDKELDALMSLDMSRFPDVPVDKDTSIPMRSPSSSPRTRSSAPETKYDIYKTITETHYNDLKRLQNIMKLDLHSLLRAMIDLNQKLDAKVTLQRVEYGRKQKNGDYDEQLFSDLNALEKLFTQNVVDDAENEELYDLQNRYIDTLSDILKKAPSPSVAKSRAIGGRRRQPVKKTVKKPVKKTVKKSVKKTVKK
jgi:hypothetical protein